MIKEDLMLEPQEKKKMKEEKNLEHKEQKMKSPLADTLAAFGMKVKMKNIPNIYPSKFLGYVKWKHNDFLFEFNVFYHTYQYTMTFIN